MARRAGQTSPQRGCIALTMAYGGHSVHRGRWGRGSVKGRWCDTPDGHHAVQLLALLQYCNQRVFDCDWGRCVLIVAVAGLKGGLGKTTLSVLLAQALAVKKQKVLLLDSDPNRSASRWASAMTADGIKFLPGSMEYHSAELGSPGNRALLEPYDYVIVDCPGGEVDGVVQGAFSIADRVLMPLAPSLIEMDALPRTRELLDNTRPQDRPRPEHIVLTRVDSRTSAAREMRPVLNEMGLGVFKAEIPERQLIKQSYGTLDALELFTPVATELLARDKKGDDAFEGRRKSTKNKKTAPTGLAAALQSTKE